MLYCLEWMCIAFPSLSPCYVFQVRLLATLRHFVNNALYALPPPPSPIFFPLWQWSFWLASVNMMMWATCVYDWWDGWPDICVITGACPNSKWARCDGTPCECNLLFKDGVKQIVDCTKRKSSFTLSPHLTDMPVRHLNIQWHMKLTMKLHLNYHTFFF